MTGTWLAITSAAAFGWAVTAWPVLRRYGQHELLSLSRVPTVATLVQAIVLWAAGTGTAGWAGSIAAGITAAAITSRFGRKEEL